MTKKHFIALADTLAHTKADRALCYQIADICANASKNFDRRRFLIACGIDPREI